jgi:hypothetical protein
MIGINIGRMIPAKLGNVQMRNLTLKGSIRLARRLAGGDPLPGAGRGRPHADPDAPLPLTDAVEAF